jgi:hypothetical protein
MRILNLKEIEACTQDNRATKNHIDMFVSNLTLTSFLNLFPFYKASLTVIIHAMPALFAVFEVDSYYICMPKHVTRTKQTLIKSLSLNLHKMGAKIRTLC